MNKTGPIIVIEDDEDDIFIMKEVFKELNFDNEIIFLKNGKIAFNYLSQTEVVAFVIICDINMPLMDGISLKKEIQKNQELKLRCVPFLFFTTAANRQDVIDAYSSSAQGFFIKPNTVNKLKTILKKIIEYWQDCESPNHY